jgi:uncharacterized membrane protein
MIHLILKTMETTTGSIAVGLVFFLIILVLMSSAFWRAIRIIFGKFIGFVVAFPEELTDEEKTLKVMKMYTPNNGVPKEYKPDSYKMNSSSYTKACTKCSSTLRVNGKCLNCEY